MTLEELLLKRTGFELGNGQIQKVDHLWAAFFSVLHARMVSRGLRQSVSDPWLGAPKLAWGILKFTMSQLDGLRSPFRVAQSIT